MRLTNFPLRSIVLLLLVFTPIISWSSNNNWSVELIGITNEQKIFVLANLSIKAISTEPEMPPDQITLLAQQGIEEITATLKALGYYHSETRLEVKPTSKGGQIRYHIETGPPVLIQSVRITLKGSGKDHPELLKLIQHCPLKRGTQLNHNSYESFKQSLLGKALQFGFLDAIYITNEIRLEPRLNQTSIILELDTGVQYKFGQVTFASSPYPEDYLKRYIPFSPGSPYTVEKLLAFQKALTDTDLFSKVRIDPLLNETQNYAVPLNTRLTPKPKNKYTASIGFSTDTDMRGMLGWERRRLNIPGHRINVNVRGSKRLNQLNAQYTIPGKRPASDRTAFGTQVTEEKYSDGKYSLRNESGVTRIQKRGKFEQITGLHYLSEVFRELPSDPKKQSHFLLPGFGFTWTNIDKTSLLQHGTRITFTLKSGLKTVFSSTNLVQGKTQIKWIYAMGEVTRLILRSDIGIMAASDASSVSIPLSLRFFTGGDQTVRGYGYNSLGPKEADRNGNLIVIGGRYLFVGSAELERRIYKNIGAAIFVDSGNAMNHWKSRLATGAGVGLRYETALGALRFDVARPMLKGKHRPRIHLTFGMNL